MSMEHRAFVFDFAGFVKELRSSLEGALVSGQLDELTRFINTNLTSLRDPYEGEPIDDSWTDMLEVSDAHQYGDFALTRFYDPADDIGLGQTWESVENLLERETGKGAALVLGNAVGPTDNYFDPGKMGSYFQSEEDVQRNLDLIKELLNRKPALAEQLDGLVKMLTSSVEEAKGLYVTF